MFNSTFRKELTDLQARFDAQTEQLTQAEAAKVKLQQQVADLEAQLNKSIAFHLTEVEKLNQAHADAIEQRVAEGVIDRCASAGIDPIMTASRVDEAPHRGLSGLSKARAILSNQSAQ